MNYPSQPPSRADGTLQVAALQTSASILSLQRRAPQEQAQTLALLNAALAAMSDGLISVDCAGTITAINPAAVALLSLSKEMVARARWVEVQAHVAAQACPAPTSDTAPASAEGAEGLDEIMLADGRVLERRQRAQQVDGVQVGTVIIYRDVTAHKLNERALRQTEADTAHRLRETELARQVLLSALEDQQRAEAAQRASEARFRASFDSAGIGMAIKAIDGRWLEVNQQLCNIVGYPSQALLQMHAQQITHPEDLPAHSALLEQLLAGRSSHFQIEKRYLHADGCPVWVRLTMAVVRDAAARPQYFVAQVEDINQRKVLERALQKSQARMQATIDALPDLMFEVDLDGRYHDYRPLHGDPLEAQSPGPIGRLMSDVLPAPAVAEAMAALSEAAATGVSKGRQLQLGPPALRWVELSVARRPEVVDEGPRFIVLSRDVTKRRESEAALRRSVAEQGALLKEVHHRVKNNLQIMHSLLRLEAARSVRPETSAMLHEMRGRIQSMALLHESIYRTSSFAAVDLADYLRQVATQALRVLRTPATAVQLRLDLEHFQLELDQALPCGLLVNELISNSLKHAFPDGRGGEIGVALRVLPDGASLHLSVRDNGTGLPPDFETRRGQSLGLQLVGDLADQLGGHLSIGPIPTAIFSVVFKPTARVMEVDL